MILGLDIGGANLKAATADKRAVSVPFPLWKQPDRLPAVLAELVGQFPDAEGFAVTMTGELCDCYETKRQGVNAILDAVEFAATGRPVRVWGTDGGWHTVADSRAAHLLVAAANWHALATFTTRFAPAGRGRGLLLDIGSTTTDIIPFTNRGPFTSGGPLTKGRTDSQRLLSRELVYLGVKRTPVCAVVSEWVAAEVFATTRDVYLVLGDLPEAPDDSDTADGRPATVEKALARLARMLGGDVETISKNDVIAFALAAHVEILTRLAEAARSVYSVEQDCAIPDFGSVVVSGAGEFLAEKVINKAFEGVNFERIVSLSKELGPSVSACAPAYALAVLATEGRSWV